MKLKGVLVVLYSVLVFSGADAAQLVSSANVSVASDTATNAKNMAFDEARRQVIIDVLSPYSDTNALHTAVKSEKTSVLMNLISSSEITNEQLSDTTYSANITMSVNDVAAKNWLDGQGIQNWVPLGTTTTNNFIMIANLSNKLSDWTMLRKTAISAGIDLKILYMEADKMAFVLPMSKRGAITIALHNNGWHYQDIDGVLNISK